MNQSSPATVSQQQQNLQWTTTRMLQNQLNVCSRSPFLTPYLPPKPLFPSTTSIEPFFPSMTITPVIEDGQEEEVTNSTVVTVEESVPLWTIVAFVVSVALFCEVFRIVLKRICLRGMYGLCISEGIACCWEMAAYRARHTSEVVEVEGMPLTEQDGLYSPQPTTVVNKTQSET
jgi:hypothetical protein